ncbi:hypothetical protein [Natronohydrobacter thiooxidans]|uniref:hypothetical protein n=1 Tax=Natronohydrobacter thiooxidans TaxID=87172 RepID=UPI0011149348|nr:hypothetical protein [Natronohydrobacter thiooxidans]
MNLGPPWLVLARIDETGEVVILRRDNFTGAGMRRVISARRQEPGSFAAVMARDGRFAVYPDGRVYDPLDETRGRQNGTMSDRGHRALLTAEALFRQMAGMSWEEASRPRDPFLQAAKILLWAVLGFLVLVLLTTVSRRPLRAQDR